MITYDVTTWDMDDLARSIGRELFSLSGGYRCLVLKGNGYFLNTLGATKQEGFDGDVLVANEQHMRRLIVPGWFFTDVCGEIPEQCKT